MKETLLDFRWTDYIVELRYPILRSWNYGRSSVEINTTHKVNP
jgi:hypothetical protein